MESATIARLERTWSENLAAIARALAVLDPHGGSRVIPLADGTIILTGPGLYVNEARCAGLERDLTDQELDILEAHSAAAGVPAAVEVTDATRPAVVGMLIERGYEPDAAISALTHPLDDLPARDPRFFIESADVASWQEVAAEGWGHTDAAARAASDIFAEAASTTDDPGLLLAFDANDARVVGCSMLAIRSGIATLGGMSTLPSERRRGVQAAMIAHRLHLAAERSCELAASTAATGSDSERNLLRHGFVPSHTQLVYRSPV